MNAAYVTPAGPLRAAVEALVAGGVRGVVICPGSRSTPLALALRLAPELSCWVHLDERAGAFFALGAAKASRRPVAILATSGTAVVNFAPAVAEARYGRVPLVLLTADRPPESQGVGTPQTIDQTALYGGHAKWYAALPVPDASVESERRVRGVLARAVDVSQTAPAGPVQVNLPFREPLLPAGPLEGPASTPPDPVSKPRPVPPLAPQTLAAAARQVAEARRGLIVCGPVDLPGFAPAVTRLAVEAHLPILADGLSNVRAGAHDRSLVVSSYDALLRLDGFRDAASPDLVLRFGARPTSKILDQVLDGTDAVQLLIDDGGGWERPRGPRLIEADPAAFASQLADAVAGEPLATDPEWLDSWVAADAAAASATDEWFAGLDEAFEGQVPRALQAALPEDSIVVVGNSMPVRDLDAFLRGSARKLRLLGNRGANGIDGLLSTALGAAMAQPQPVVAVVGDLSFLHDLNALVAAARLGANATVVLVNNDGGGIFSFLPQAAATRPDVGLPEHFEELFGTPHGIAFGPLVEALGGRHRTVEAAELVPQLEAAVGRAGLDVLELRTERRRNVELHRQAFDAVAIAVEARP